MASGKEFPLAIILRTVDQATPGLRKMDAGLSKLSRSMDKIGKASVKVGKSLTTSLTLPLVGIGLAGAKAMSEFNEGMAQVGTLIDTSTEDLDAMGNAVRELGKRTPVTFGDLTSGLYDVRSAGVKAADAMGVLESAAQLGVAGRSDTATSVKLMTSAMNAFSIQASDSAAVSDVLFTAVKHGITDISQLQVGFGAVAGKMADAGIEFDEYMSAVSALTSVGLPAAQAHTQMRAAIDGLTKSSKPLHKIFKKLHAESFQELIQKSGGVVPAMMKVRDAVGGSEAKLRALIGSSEGSAAAMSVTGTTYQAFTETLTDMRDGVTEVDKKFIEMNSTAASKWKKAKNSLTGAAISIGTVLTPALEKLADKLSAASEWFDSLSDDSKETIVVIGAVVAAVGPALFIFGKLALAISTVTKVVRVMSLAMAANPIAALAIVIGAAALSIYSNWEDFEDFFRLLWGLIKGIFKGAWEYIGPIIERIVDGARSVLQAGSDVKAYLSGEATSGDRKKESSRNTALDAEFFGRTGTHLPGFGPPALGADGGASLAAATSGVGKSQIEVNIKGAPKGTRVETKSSDKKVDLSVGHQTTGLD